MTDKLATAVLVQDRSHVSKKKKIHQSFLRECLAAFFFFLVSCELYQSVFLSALFLHASADCSHSFQCCHIGTGSSLYQKNPPRYRIAAFIQRDSGELVGVERANEIVAKLRELETEQNLVKDLFNRALRAGQSGSDVQLNFRQAERHMPGICSTARPQNTLNTHSRWRHP